MAYEQYMKHSRNHKKDRYYQQCSGYFGKSLKELEEGMMNSFINKEQWDFMMRS